MMIVFSFAHDRVVPGAAFKWRRTITRWWMAVLVLEWGFWNTWLTCLLVAAPKIGAMDFNRSITRPRKTCALLRVKVLTRSTTLSLRLSSSFFHFIFESFPFVLFFEVGGGWGEKTKTNEKRKSLWVGQLSPIGWFTRRKWMRRSGRKRGILLWWLGRCVRHAAATGSCPTTSTHLKSQKKKQKRKKRGRDLHCGRCWRWWRSDGAL